MQVVLLVCYIQAVMKVAAILALLRVLVNCTLFFSYLLISALRKALQFSQRQKYLRNASRFVSAVYSDS